MPQYMPKPKSSCMGPECMGCSSPECMAKGGEIKGVNKPSLSDPGKSSAGVKLNPAFSMGKKFDTENSKDEHRKTLSEMKAMKSHDRTNLAEGGKVWSRMTHEKGVHSPGYGDSPKHGESFAGNAIRSGSKPSQESGKDQHKGILSEIKSMKSQDRTNLAEGGEVEEYEDHDDELSGMLGHELMEAFEKKDKKAIMSALEACVLRCMNKE